MNEQRNTHASSKNHRWIGLNSIQHSCLELLEFNCLRIVNVQSGRHERAQCRSSIFVTFDENFLNTFKKKILP